jgi:SAM-dependent methyltransferase
LKSTLVSLLVCPTCRHGFNLLAKEVEDSEVIEGSLLCQGCGREISIVTGVPRFLKDGLNPEQKATADAFGYEWTHYSTLTDADKKEFLAWISPLTPAGFKDQIVLDAGCGKGRHTFLAAQFGARTVVGVDLSDAVDAAFRNTRHLSNAHVIQADILDLPFKNPFDLAYSIGVIHHLPVPKSGFLALCSHLKPGGRISTWVYGKEGNLWIERLVDPIRKNITSRLSKFITRRLCFLPAVTLFVGLKLLYRPAKQHGWLKRLLPYSDYLCSISDYSFSENFWNVFDQLVAPTAFYHSREEVVDWFKTAEGRHVEIARHNSNSWRGTGLIPTTATSSQSQRSEERVFEAGPYRLIGPEK